MTEPHPAAVTQGLTVSVTVARFPPAGVRSVFRAAGSRRRHQPGPSRAHSGCGSHDVVGPGLSQICGGAADAAAALLGNVTTRPKKKQAMI